MPFALLLLLLAGRAAAGGEDPAAAAPKHFELVSVGEGVWAAIARQGDSASLSNAGFVVGGDGVLVVDAFATPAAAEELLAEIRKRTPLPVRWLVNTHYHLDHVGGDAVFVKAGAEILAHENVRAWVRTENLHWRGVISAEDRAMLARLPLPDVTYREGATIWLKDREVRVLTRPGHTGGDSAVFVPSSDVLFTGDLLWKTTVPNLVDSTAEAWINTLDGFLAGYPSATYVPGHGDVGKALDVRSFRDYLSGLRLSVARALQQGKSGKELVDWLLPGLRARYGTWTWFDRFAGKNIEQTEEEIKGSKKLLSAGKPGGI